MPPPIYRQGATAELKEFALYSLQDAICCCRVVCVPSHVLAAHSSKRSIEMARMI